jgi:hypothetical protein
MTLQKFLSIVVTALAGLAGVAHTESFDSAPWPTTDFG